MLAILTELPFVRKYPERVAETAIKGRLNASMRSAFTVRTSSIQTRPTKGAVTNMSAQTETLTNRANAMHLRITARLPLPPRASSLTIRRVVAVRIPDEAKVMPRL